jgi:hypothetical protein
MGTSFSPDGSRARDFAASRRFPRDHVHVFRLEKLGDIDAEFRTWLVEAYAVGEQRHLAKQ